MITVVVVVNQLSSKCICLSAASPNTGKAVDERAEHVIKVVSHLDGIYVLVYTKCDCLRLSILDWQLVPLMLYVI